MARLWVEEGSQVEIVADGKIIRGTIRRHITGLIEVLKVERVDAEPVMIHIVAEPELTDAELEAELAALEAEDSMANELRLLEGCQVSLVRGHKMYRGVVSYDPSGNGRWFIKLENSQEGEPDEIEIYILKEVGD